MNEPICVKCRYCMKLNIMLTVPAKQAGIQIEGMASQMITGYACQLTSVPISNFSMPLECSEFEERSEPFLMKKPRPVVADA